MTRYAPQTASHKTNESIAPRFRHHSAVRPIPTAVRLACGTLLAGGAYLQPAIAQTAPAETVLPKVTVSAKQTRADDLPPAQAGGLAGSGARLGLLGNQDVMDTPFNVTSYTAKLIEDQQAKTVADVLNNDASVRFTTSGAHAYENFRLRGFDVHSSDLAINGLYGLAPLGSSSLEFIERVEVLRGPSAMYTGMAPSGGIGGVINLVPKRAGGDPLTRVTLSHETESQLSTHLDIGRRFGEDQAIGVRVNASYGDGETALQEQHKKRHLLSAALDYRGAALTASLDLYDSQLSFDGGSPAMYGFATTTIPKAPDPRVNYLEGAAGELKSKAAIAHAEYSFSRDITAFASLGTRKHDYAGWLNGTHAHSVQADGSALVRGVAQLGYDDSNSAEIGTRINFGTAGVRHELVLHATRLELESGSLSNVTGMQASNIYNPITPTLPAMPTGPVPKGSESTLSSLALVDTLSFMQDTLRLTLGLRQQQVEQTGYSSSGAVNATYDEKALTPAVGLVVKPWGDGLSLYANYVQGLSKGDTVSDVNATNYGHVFKPYKTEQKELGVKWNAGRFIHTASLFQIDKPTMMSTGPSTSPTYTDGAETRVRGVEWNASGEVGSALRVLGGLSYTKGELTKTQGGVNQGKEVFGVPHWQGNFGAQWDTPLSGLSLNARVITTAKQYLDSANTSRIPGWGQLDLGAAYSTKVADRKLVLRLNVDNAFDRHYWSGSFAEPRATLAQGRIVRTSATMDF
jgi:iron complex outermembrane recepter protein